MRMIGFAVLLVAATADAQSQDLGRKLPGGVGLDAGSQSDQGLYLADRFVWFASEQVNDRDGASVPIEGLDIDVMSNVIGIAGTIRLADVYASCTIAVPVVRVSINADEPPANVDRLGLGDTFIEPLKLGHRGDRFDAVGSYAFYAPTSGDRPGVGRRQWSHQASVGGTVFKDARRGWRASALAGYLHNRKKIGIDITRGDSFQIQGGFGGPVLADGGAVLELGIAGYAVWQVTDDRGADLPVPLRGARERTFGLGPELGLAVPSLRVRITGRIEWDFAGEARPVGSILVFGLSFVAWTPDKAGGPAD